MTQRDTLIDAGLRLAATHGYDRVSRAMLAREAGVSETLLSYYWPAAQWRDELMRAAVRDEVLTVIAQGLVERDPIALAAPLDLRVRAAEGIVGNDHVRN